MNSLTFKLIVSIVACMVLGALSGIRTTESIQTWYLELHKPSWNPPNWIFGPVWSVLYLLMGVSFALVWHSQSPLRTQAILIFLVQFFLNLAWSEIFFIQRHIGFALLEMTCMWIAILICIFQFYTVHRWASFLMLPYLAWVGFASFLTFTIWRLN